MLGLLPSKLLALRHGRMTRMPIVARLSTTGGSRAGAPRCGLDVIDHSIQLAYPKILYRRAPAAWRGDVVGASPRIRGRVARPGPSGTPKGCSGQYALRGRVDGQDGGETSPAHR